MHSAGIFQITSNLVHLKIYNLQFTYIGNSNNKFIFFTRNLQNY